MIEHFQIYGVNPKNENRARTSVVIARKVGSHSHYYIVVRGEQASMKELLDMNDSEQTIFRNLMVQYKEQNLIRFIYAQKRLTKEEVTSFVNQYSGIIKSKKYDTDSIMRVAGPLEKKLKFVGCLGVKAKIREEAKPVVDRFIEGGIKVSILSGDSYENTINIGKELGLSPINPTDTSSYFNLSFDSISRAKSDFSLYIEQIYHELKTFNYTTLNRSLENPSKEKVEDQFLHRVGEFSSNNISKCMVIGGRQLDILKVNPILSDYFRILLIFTKNIIGHDLLPHQKAMLSKLLRRKGEVVMAVGDGLNDIGMMNEANLSIQLSNGDVPLYFGDIVVNRLDIITRLVFFTGFNLFKNIKGMLLFHTLIWAKLVLVNIWAFSISRISTGFFYHYHVTFLVGLFVLETFYKVCFVSHYPAELLAANPQVYQEKGIFENRIISVFYLCSLSIGFEIAFIYLLGRYGVGRENFSNGYVFHQEVFYLYFFTMLWFNTGVTNYFFSSTSLRYRLLIYMLMTALFGVIIVYHVFFLLPTAYEGFTAFKVFTNIIFITSYIVAWLAPSYLNSIVMTVLQAKLIDPIKFYLKFNRSLKIKQPWHIFVDDNKDSIRKFISLESVKTTSDMIIDQVADVIQPSKSKPIDPIIQKLLLLNIHEFSVGFDQLTNQILDQREHNKFSSINAEKHHMFTIRFVLSMIGMYLIAIGILLYYVGINGWTDIEPLYRQNVGYLTLVFVTMLIFLSIKKKGDAIYRVVNSFMILSLAVEIALFVADTVLPQSSTRLPFHELGINPRMISSAIPLNFPQAVVLIVLFEGMRIIRILFYSSPISYAIRNTLFLTILFIDLIALAAVKISMKKKVGDHNPV